MTEHILIKAHAGAGKTTKIKQKLTELEGTIILLSFNKSIERELAHLSVDNVTIRTFHSVAMQHCKQVLGLNFQPVPSYFNSQIKKLLNTDTRTASILIEVLKDFCYSDYTIQDFHMFMYENENYCKIMDITDTIVAKFKQLWKLLITSDKLSHDVYLKLFSLDMPVLNYDYIIIDEYQDFSSVMSSVIKANADTSNIIMSMDSNQTIYQWKGGTGDKIIEFKHEIKLDKTYRCPQGVVDMVNPYLRLLDGSEMTTVSTIEDSVHVLNTDILQWTPKDQEDYTYISRTNPSLFILAESYVGRNWNINIIVGSDMSSIEQHYRWLNNEVSGNKFLDEWFKGDKKELVKLYASTNQQNKISQLFCADAIKDLDKLKRHMRIEDPELPTMTFTNVFMSKGLEYDNVLIVPDFQSPYDQDEDFITDAHLKYLYVAMTRTKKRLFLNSMYVPTTEILEIPETVEYVEIDNIDGTFLDKKLKLLETQIKYKAKKEARKQKDQFEDDHDLRAKLEDKGYQVDIGITHISKDDAGLSMAIARDNKNIDENNINMDENSYQSRVHGGNARRYMESKMTGISISALEHRDEQEFLLPTEDSLYKNMLAMQDML